LLLISQAIDIAAVVFVVVVIVTAVDVALVVVAVVASRQTGRAYSFNLLARFALHATTLTYKI